MTVRSILDTKGHDILSVEPDAKLSAAVKILSERRIGAVLVMCSGRIEGILSERDIVRVIGERGAAVLDEPVSSVMTRKVVCCRPTDNGGGDHGKDDRGQVPASAGARGGRARRPDFDRDVVKWARQGIRERAGSAAELHQDRLIRPVQGFFSTGSGSPAPGARIAMASWIDSIARSAARVPCAINSSARWKSNQPIWPTRGVISRSGGSPASRARVMRSCMMLKASTHHRGDAGASAAAEELALHVRSGEKNFPSPRRGGGTTSITGAGMPDGAPWE